MNTELLQRIRNLKLQGLDDAAIINSLSSEYSLEEIDKCLQPLQYMRPQLSDTQDSVTVAEVPSIANSVKGNVVARHKFLIGILLLLVVLFLVMPLASLIFKEQSIKKLDTRIANAYNLKESYPAGSMHKCSTSSATRFGDIAGLTQCVVVTARIYYPRVLISHTEQYDDTTSESNALNNNRIYYVDSSNKPAPGLSVLASMIPEASKLGAPSATEKSLGIKSFSFDHVQFSGLIGLPATNGTTALGPWQWETAGTWLDTGNEFTFATGLSKKVLANEAPVRGAPTAKEALVEGRAPLIAFFIMRYCHSPRLPLLDHACVLPN